MNIGGLYGGLNLYEPQTAIADNECTESIDCMPGASSMVEPRLAFSNSGSVASYSTLLQIYEQQNPGSVTNPTVWVLRDDGAIYRDSALIQSGAGVVDSYKAFFGEYLNAFYFRKGPTELYKWDGTTSSLVNTFSNEITDVAFYENRIFVSTAGSNQERIYYSPVGTDTSFTDYIFIPAQGERAYTMTPTSNGIYIGTGKGTYLLAGRSALSFSIRKVLDNISPMAGFSLNWRENLVFIDWNSRKLYIWDGYGVPIVLDEHMRSGEYLENYWLKPAINTLENCHFSLNGDLLTVQHYNSSTSERGMWVFDLGKTRNAKPPVSYWDIAAKRISGGSFISMETGTPIYARTFRPKTGGKIDSYDIDGANYNKILPSVTTKYFHMENNLFAERIYRTSFCTVGSGTLSVDINSFGSTSDTRNYEVSLNDLYSVPSITTANQASASTSGPIIAVKVAYDDIDDYATAQTTKASEVINVTIEFDTENP